MCCKPRVDEYVPLKPFKEHPINNHSKIHEPVNSSRRKEEKKPATRNLPKPTEQISLGARCTVSVSAIVSVSTLRAATVVDKVRGSSLLPVIHTLSLISITPVTSLAAISLLAHDLLLGPNSMASLIIPDTSRKVLSRDTLGLRLSSLKAHTEADALELSTDAGADGVGALLADFLSDELRGGAGLGAGAVDVTAGLLPWGVLDRGLEDVVVVPALSDSGELVGVGGSVGCDVGS